MERCRRHCVSRIPSVPVTMPGHISLTLGGGSSRIPSGFKLLPRSSMKVGRLIWRPCRLSVVVVMGNILGTGWGAISGAPGELLGPTRRALRLRVSAPEPVEAWTAHAKAVWSDCLVLD